MNRGAVAFDRFAGIVAGLVLVLGGLLMAAWWQGVLTNHLPSVPHGIHRAATAVSNQTDATWWPWAVGVAGVVLALLALQWLFGHIGHHAVRRLRLPGSDGTGQLQVRSSGLMDAAGAELSAVPGVEKASGRMVHDRGSLVADLDVTLSSDADLNLVSDRIDEVVNDFASAVQDPSLTYRVRASVSRGSLWGS